MENNQQNNEQKNELKNDRLENKEVKQSTQNVQSTENKNTHLSSTAERHSESSMPKGTNETLGTP